MKRGNGQSVPEGEVALPSMSQLKYAAHISVTELQDFCGDKRNRRKCGCYSICECFTNAQMYLVKVLPERVQLKTASA